MAVNPLNEVMRDVVALVEPDRTRVGEIRASVQSTKIMVADGSLPIEEGDTIERKRPGDIVERYTVLDAGYRDKFYEIPAHFQMEVRKETALPRVPPGPSHNYYLTGPNSRVNTNSVDASENVALAPATQLFEDLRGALAEIADVEQRVQLLARVDEMESSQGSSGFLARYQAFVQAAANHITIIGPFLPALTQLLS
jgi:hypothetical protein